MPSYATPWCLPIAVEIMWVVRAGWDRSWGWWVVVGRCIYPDVSCQGHVFPQVIMGATA
jgi:hypothetical protein